MVEEYLTIKVYPSKVLQNVTMSRMMKTTTKLCTVMIMIKDDKDVKDTHRKLGSIEVKTSKVNGELAAPHRQPLKVGHLQKFDPLENNFWKFGKNCRVL